MRFIEKNTFFFQKNTFFDIGSKPKVYFCSAIFLITEMFFNEIFTVDHTRCLGDLRDL